MRVNQIFKVIVFLILTGLYACTQDSKPSQGFVHVFADGQTKPVPDSDDAADDPAIWIHPEDPSKSTIIGSNKQRGLHVYDLQGNELFNYPIGRVNNIDVRYGFSIGKNKIDIIAGSNRSDNSVFIMGIDSSTGELYEIEGGKIITGMVSVYGFCLYHSKNTNKYYAIVNDKSGLVRQYHLYEEDTAEIGAELVREFNVGSQPEGCVADDELGYLYIGEEAKGIWKYYADPEKGDARSLVDSTDSYYLQADIEGLTIYYAGNEKGYLIVSSQGNNSYAIYRRSEDNSYVGTFRIMPGEQIDGTYDTDGIDVLNMNLDENYPFGIFVAQSGYKDGAPELENQNFKLVRWDKIAKSFDPPLIIDNTYDIR